MRKRNRDTEKRGERQGRGGERSQPEAGRGRRGGYFEGVGARWGPRGERAPPPRVQNGGDWTGLSWACREGQGRDGEVPGLRSVVGFLLHPTWGGKRQTQRDGHGEKHKEKERKDRDGRKDRAEAQTDRERRHRRDMGRQRVRLASDRSARGLPAPPPAAAASPPSRPPAPPSAPSAPSAPHPRGSCAG